MGVLAERGDRFLTAICKRDTYTIQTEALLLLATEVFSLLILYWFIKWVNVLRLFLSGIEKQA